MRCGVFQRTHGGYLGEARCNSVQISAYVLQRQDLPPCRTIFWSAVNDRAVRQQRQNTHFYYYTARDVPPRRFPALPRFSCTFPPHGPIRPWRHFPDNMSATWTGCYHRRTHCLRQKDTTETQERREELRPVTGNALIGFQGCGICEWCTLIACYATIPDKRATVQGNINHLIDVVQCYEGVRRG